MVASRGDELRQRVFALAAEQTGYLLSRLKDATDIERDIKITGDDVYDLFERMQREFEIDFSAMRFNRHFDPEVPTWKLVDFAWMIGGMGLILGLLARRAAASEAQDSRQDAPSRRCGSHKKMAIRLR